LNKQLTAVLIAQNGHQNILLEKRLLVNGSTFVICKTGAPLTALQIANAPRLWQKQDIQYPGCADIECRNFAMTSATGKLPFPRPFSRQIPPI